MPIAATQESSGAISVISFSLGLVKWDIFLKDLTPRAMLLEDILTFIFNSMFAEILCSWIKSAQKLERNTKSALRWQCYY